MTLPHLQRASAAVVLVDFQERLAAAMPEQTVAEATKQAGVLLEGARLLGLPVLATEQYPKGLGHTVPALAAFLPASGVLEKLEFACSAAPGFLAKLEASGRRQVILAGMEAHICVLQTAFGLLRQGYEVVVAEDAICSRSPRHAEAAVRNAERAGAWVLPVESILFALLERAGTPEFKEVSRLVR